MAEIDLQEAFSGIHNDLKFPHYFFLVSKTEGPSYEYDLAVRRSIEEWMKEKATGQWFFVRLFNDVTVYSPPKFESPLSGQSYDHSALAVPGRFLLGFESEDDAAQFKLVFGK